MSSVYADAGRQEPDEGSPAETAAASQRPWHRRARVVWAVLFIILSLALALRLYGIDWDGGGLFHPDERAILSKVSELDLPSIGDLPDLLDADKSTLNPNWFSYGSLPLYMLKGVDVAASPFTDLNIFDLRFPGRVMSAMADTALIGLIFLFGRAWLGNRVGLLAALFAALAVIEIQLSHFFAVDTFLALFGAASVFFMVRVGYTGKKSDSLAAGVLVGLALATKASAAVLLVPLIFSHLLYIASEPGEFFRLSRSPEEIRARAKSVLSRLLYAGAGIVGALYVTQPYMFLDWGTYRESVTRESEMVRRITDLPFTRQYIDTPRYLYQFWQLGTYGLGPVLGMLAWGSLFISGVYALRKRRKFDLVVLSYVVPYLLITGWFDVKFLRYMLPILPFLLLYAARVLIWGLDIVRDWRPDLRYAGPVAIGLVVAVTAHYAISYETIYSRPHPAQATSDWIIENTPRDSLVLKEHWEEGLPRLEPRFREELELYNPDTDFKFDRISSQLARADYLVFYSNRLYATLPRLEERYPLSTRYYEKLFDGTLGYELVHTERSVPSFLGISYDEDTFGRTDLGEPAGYDADNGDLATISFGWADESFYVYDHPKTLVFQNVERLGEREIFARIQAIAPRQEPVVGLMLSDRDLAVQRAGGTISDITDFGTGTAGISWIIWLLAAQIIGILAVPLGFFLFKPLAGRGYLLSKVLGLLVVSFLAWFMASVGIMDFSRGSVLFSMLILGLISAVILVRNRGELTAYFRENSRLIVIMELIFLVTFFIFLFIRMANPDLWHPFRGGEKPMDFAYLNAVTRSTVMPPFDPWFAGGFLNYYYFGQFIVAMMIRLTGIETAIAYNLAIPLLFALSAGAIFAIVYALVDGARVSMGGAARLTRGPVLAGIGGVVFILFAGNLDGLVQVFQGASRALFQDQPFGDFDFWRSSRMFAAGSPGHEITEFPFFTFLFADLHAHLMALPFTLLALGLSLAVLLSAAENRKLRVNWSVGEMARLALLGIAVGSLRLINAWDYPTYLIIGVAAVFLAEAYAHGGFGLVMASRAAVKSVIVFAAGYIVFFPFIANYETFFSSLDSTTTTTVLWQFLVVNGLFIFIIGSFFVSESRGWLLAIGRALREKTSLIANTVSQDDDALAVERPQIGAWWIVGLAIGALVLGLGLTAVFSSPREDALIGSTVPFVALLLVLVLTVGLKWIFTARPDSPYVAFVTIMIAVSLMLVIGLDIFRVENDIGRMNSVFKFYLQIWVMLALASAYLLWRMAHGKRITLRRLTPARKVWIGALTVLILSASIYPALGTQDRLRDRFNGQVTAFTLDGNAYVENTVYRDAKGNIDLETDFEGIRWLQDNVQGSPIVLEGVTPIYRWGSRVSINTGLPSVIGWQWHQQQQRWDYRSTVDDRINDVNTIYSTTSPQDALSLLRKYDVKYVYVGDVERLYYPDDGLDKFETALSDDLDTVFQNDKVTIYRVR
ncbi:MAG: glycosyltransferase family 39 protein [Chloroflexi bacterium]|nr:glycosyltransferase family 39 protein [Chloroflexota bacterium]